jgi:hypothetical protein
MSNPFEELNNKLKDQETKLTKREFIATHVMAGYLAGHSTTDVSAIAARNAVELTDKLIAELNKPRSN